MIPLPARRFPPPWSVEDVGGCFAVKASNGRPLIFIYYGEGVGRRSLARLLTRNAARSPSCRSYFVERNLGQLLMSAFGGQADMRRGLLNVCFLPKADIGWGADEVLELLQKP